MANINLAIFVVRSEAKDQIDFTGCQGQLLRVRDDSANVLNQHPAILVSLEPTVGEEVISQLLDVDVHDSAACEIEANIIQVAGKVCVFDFIIAKLHDIVTEE